ncbi:MAG: TMEM14 family protein, partial [Verrucomicrobia bacterium]|nr:TMEM14 family protein [Verrucomicrobiota bacterium]
MFLFAKIYFLVFGLITIASGLTGFFKAGSKASLIAGGILGVLLLVAAYLV